MVLSILDYDPEEVKRQVSINTTVAPVEWEGHKINLLDTPGYFRLRPVRSRRRYGWLMALLSPCVLPPVSKWARKRLGAIARRWKFPACSSSTKMDRENANFQKVLDALQEMYGANVVPLHLPIGEAENFTGLVDLVRMKGYKFVDGKAPGV